MIKKICFVTTVSVTLELFVLKIAEELHRNGNYDITFICDSDEDFAANLPEYIRYIPFRLYRGIDLRGIEIIGKFIKVFKNNNFDMVVYLTPNASFYASIAAKITKIPIRLYAQWGIRYVGFSGFKRIVFKFLEKCVCKNSTHIRPVSNKNKDFAVLEGLYESNKAKVLGKGGSIGVDLNIYDLSKKNLWREEIRSRFKIKKKFVFGFVGRLSGDKGTGELFAAFLKLRRVYKDAVLLIIGEDEIGKSINSDLVKSIRHDSGVIFTGHVKNSEIHKYYSAMDVLVHPTYREGFGMVLQEAGAMAVAILTTDIPGASEVMENNVSCILCKPKDVESLYNAMLKMIDFKLCEFLGKSARIRVEENFERSKMLQMQLEDYENLMS